MVFLLVSVIKKKVETTTYLFRRFCLFWAVSQIVYLLFAVKANNLGEIFVGFAGVVNTNRKMELESVCSCS